jgi:periodic tryptophan protein 2
VEKRDVLEGGNVKLNLPGTKKNDVTSRNFHPEVGVYSIEFSPNGQQWSAATTEGLLVYSLDKGIVFDPYQLSIEVTPKMTRSLLEQEEFANALVMALKLNESELVQEVMEKIPHREIPLILDNLPDNFVHRTIEFVTKMLNTHPREFYLKWTTLILTKFGQKTDVLSPQILINLQQNLNRKYEALQKICDFNKFTMRVIKNIAAAKKLEKEAAVDSDEEMDGNDGNLLLVRKDESEQEMITEDEDDTSEE